MIYTYNTYCQLRERDRNILQSIPDFIVKSKHVQYSKLNYWPLSENDYIMYVIALEIIPSRLDFALMSFSHAFILFYGLYVDLLKQWNLIIAAYVIIEINRQKGNFSKHLRVEKNGGDIQFKIYLHKSRNILFPGGRREYEIKTSGRDVEMKYNTCIVTWIKMYIILRIIKIIIIYIYRVT